MRKTKGIRRIISMILCLCLLLGFFHEMTVEVKGERWNGFSYNVLVNGTVEITGYGGLGNNIVIPTSINGRMVTRIGNQAFYGCNNLMYLGLPSGITSIGSYAFYNCNNLLGIDIPLGVTSIETGAFCGCSSLTSISIPSGVTDIKNNTFYGCSSLMNISISPRITSIGSYSFCDCDSLTNISIPLGVTSIGEFAFYGCGNLTSINIPPTVSLIEEGVFDSCSSKLIVYGTAGSVAEGYAIENGIAFRTDDEDEHIKETLHLPKAGTTRTLSSGKYLITKSTKSKKTVTYMKPVNAKKATVTIPDTVKISGSTYLVTEIAAGAFKNNGKVKSITIGKNIVKIGKEAFYGCKNLKYINFKTKKLKNVGKNFLSNNKGKIKTPKGYQKKYEKLFKNAIAK